MFADGTVPSNLTLLEPPAVDGKGTVYLRYGLDTGTPDVGNMDDVLTD